MTTARAKERITSAAIWAVASIPILTLIGALALLGTGDYRNPFAP